MVLCPELILSHVLSRFSAKNTSTSGRKWESTHKDIQGLEMSHTTAVTSILRLVPVFFHQKPGLAVLIIHLRDCVCPRPVLTR